MKKINYWYWVIAAIVVLMVGVVWTRTSQAQQVFNVQHDGVPAFCATGVVAGTWNFVGTCEAPPADPGVVPPGRLLRGQDCLTYTSSGLGCYLADYTSYQNTFGRYLDNATRKPTQPAVPFPGVNFYANLFNFTKTGYAAFAFTAPANLPPKAQGTFGRSETPINQISNPYIDGAISTKPGDFNPPLVICKRLNYNAGGVKWKNSLIPDSLSIACPLVAGQTYYYNVRISPTGVCGGTCYVGLQNNWRSQ